MKDDDLRRAFEAFEGPDERRAGTRAWSVARSAFEGREPVPWPKRPGRPAIALALIALLAAAALSPAGGAVLDSIRRVVGAERAQPALFALPAPGRLLVSSDAGAWVVQQDGSKRLLGGWKDAAWSPNGLYVAVVQENELAAVAPDGEVRWKLSRPAVRLPRWGGTRTDTRIAYFSGHPRSLRVVAGDGSPDRLLAARPHVVAPAWRPSGGHVLAFSDRRGAISIAAVDGENGRAGRSTPGERPIQLAWSPDGDRVLALGRRTLRLLDSHGRLAALRSAPPGVRNVAAAFHPTEPTYALVRYRARADRSEVLLSDGRRVFDGTGRFTDVVWSPDARWLLVSWREADQLIFVRVSGERRIEAVANVSAQFESATFPRLVEWCCPRD